LTVRHKSLCLVSELCVNRRYTLSIEGKLDSGRLSIWHRKYWPCPSIFRIQVAFASVDKDLNLQKLRSENLESPRTGSTQYQFQEVWNISRTRTHISLSLHRAF